MPFYFDAIIEGSSSLEILGDAVVRPESGAMEVALKTRSRWGPSPFEWRESTGLPMRWVDSAVRLKPDEIVEVPLPRLEASAGIFANRTYSLRIRARQLR